MESVSINVHRYHLATTLTMGDDDIQQVIDEGLLHAAKDLEVPELAEFIHQVTIGDFALPRPESAAERAAAETAAKPAGEGDAGAAATFRRLQPFLAELLAVEVSQLARRRLKGQNWAVQHASVETGSLTLTVMITSLGVGIMNYKKLREGIVQIHKDMVDHAIPFAKEVLKACAYHEMFPQAAAMDQAAIDQADITREIPAAEGGEASPEATVLLRQILTELRALRSIVRPALV